MLKKILAALLAIMLIIGTMPMVFADDAPTIDEDTTLRVHYWLNGDTNDTQRDLKHAVNAGGVTFVSDSQFGTVASFPGGNGSSGTGYLSIPGDAFLGSSPAESMTVTAWFYQNSRVSYARVFDFGVSTTKNFWYMPYNGARAAITVGGSSAETQATGSAVANRAWHHMAISLDAQNKTLTYYLDGTQIMQKSCTIAFSDIQSTTASSNKFYIGKSQYGDGLFNGRMFDFRVYDTAKDAAEVTAIMNSALSDDVKLTGDMGTINLGTTSNRTTDVTLPATGKSGSTFTWTSSNNDIINAETGKLTRPLYTNANETETVVLTVVGTLGEETATKTFTFTVPRLPSPAEVVASDLASLTLGDLSALTQSITLPTAGKLGSTITWATSNAALAADGTVTRPAPTAEHASGTLTATISYQTTEEDKASDTKTFDFTVLRLPSDQDYCDNDAAALSIGNLISREENFTLPAAGASGATTITWQSSNATWVTNDGIVTRPNADYTEETVTVTLTATIAKGDAAVTKDFVITIDRRPMDLILTGVNDITATTKAGNLPKLPYYIPGTYVDGMGNVVEGPAVRVNWYGYQNSKGSTSYSTNPATAATAFTNVGDVIEVRGRVPEYSTTAYVTAYVTVVEDDGATAPEGKLLKDFHLSKVQFNNYENGNVPVFKTHQANFINKLTNTASADGFLYMFRYTFLTDSPKGSALGGWDNAGTLLRGHATGHYIVAMSQAYADTQADADQTLHNKISDTLNYVIDELYTMSKISQGDPAAVKANSAGSVIQGSSRRKDYENWGEGFISAYPPDQFVMLENGAAYGSSPSGIWAPYYTLHKILSGFIACYLNTGNEKALEIASGMGIWVYKRLSQLPESTLYNMWNRYIAGEYGGMNEVMATLYDITKDERFMEGAQLFDNTAFFFGSDKKSGLANNVDTIRGRHANQHIPQIVGSLKIFEITGDKKYWDVANNFMDMALNSYNFAIGGVAGNNSNVECFTAQPNQIASTLHDSNNNQCETCATYNMCKLARQLFMFTGDAKYMDYYERAWYNQLAASVDNNCGNTYHIPLDGGSSKSYGNQNMNGFTCCNGTSIETNTKLQDTIYFQSVDENAVYVNLYAPSTLTMDDVTLTQITNFPYSNTVKIEVSGSGEFDLMARVPAWATEGYFATVNGEALDLVTVPSSYVLLGREWNDGDVIELNIPQSLHMLKTMDKANVGSIFYGPILLAGTESSSLSALRKIDLNGQDLSKSVTVNASALTATVAGQSFTLKPFWEYTTGRYSVYYDVNYTKETFKNVTFAQLEKAIAQGDAITAAGAGTDELAAALAAAKAIDGQQGFIQTDIDDAAKAVVYAMQGIEAAPAPVYGVVADKEEYLINEDITLTVTTPVDAVKVGVFNENGKGITKVSSSFVETEDAKIWTIVVKVATKGERSIFVKAINDEQAYADVDYLGSTAFSVVPEIVEEPISEDVDPKIIAGSIVIPISAKAKTPFTVTFKTTKAVTNVGIFNEKGAGVSAVKSFVDAEGYREWTVELSVSSSGDRTFAIGLKDGDSEWIMSGYTFSLSIKK